MTVTPELVHETVRRLTATGGPFEVTIRDIAGVTHRVFTHAASTLVDILQMGRGHGDADFLVYGEDRWSFDRFFTEVDALAACLQHDLGIGVGDRVAIAMRNSPDWVTTFAAAALIGAVVVPINSWGSAEELQFTLNNCGAAVLAADLPRARLAFDTLVAGGIPLLFSDIDGPLTELPRHPESRLDVRGIRDVTASVRNRDYTLAAPLPEDIALLLYTSGSTGTPKGVIYRNVAVGQALMNMFFVGFLSMELGGNTELRGGATVESQLVTVPLFHATGLFSGFLLPCAVAQKVAMLRKWDAETAMRVIEQEKITMLSTVPAILKDLLTHPRLGEFDVSSISRVAAAGAATPSDLPGLLEERLGIVTRSSGYGMTETASVCATMSGAVFDLKPLASGILSPIIELRVAGADGAVVASTEEGEIQLRGVTVTPGYWLRDDMTREAFTGDGWLRTGDLGHLDEDGFLHVTGRIKEIVIRGGENISPIEIENVAYRHPAVKEVAVFGVPDDAMGEELALVCHPQPDAALSEQDLREHLRITLPAFKVPKYITITDKPLPRNASEKIHRLAVSRDFSRES
jgi:long-chain acyl-CoA synthetase